ncbi:hypothetical protein [Candidatus Nitrosocosmicus sp. SS]|jgi:hypothetical protein|nr:hypothetical protein [Candidatus Nitrosocosmicus sp. SS]
MTKNHSVKLVTDIPHFIRNPVGQFFLNGLSNENEYSYDVWWRINN